jgi:hypothetical protein
MAIVDTPRTFRDALDGVMGEHSVGQTDDTVRKIERCVAWRELVAETIYRLVGSLLEAGAQEQEVAEQMAHPPVPTWSTTELAATQSGTSGLAQFRPLEVGLTGALPHPGELALGDSELLRARRPRWAWSAARNPVSMAWYMLWVSPAASAAARWLSPV